MRVAVIIPCFNVAGLLPKALDSVLAQTHQDLDIVCVDDGSTDGTGKVVEAYAARTGGRVRLLTTPNRGASAARNAGMRITAGELIQFLDADDTIDPGKIAAQVGLVSGHDLVVGDFEQVMPNGLRLSVEALYGAPWEGLVATKLGCTCSNLWSRKAIEAVGGWNEAMASSQDYELAFRVLRNGARTTWDRQVLTRVLKRSSGSISSGDKAGNWERYITLRRAIKEYMERTDPVGFAAEIELSRQYIFMALRIVAKTDPAAALAEYGRSIGRRFSPMVGQATTEPYVFLHDLLGFATTERLWRMVQKARS